MASSDCRFRWGVGCRSTVRTYDRPAGEDGYQKAQRLTGGHCGHAARSEYNQLERVWVLTRGVGVDNLHTHPPRRSSPKVHAR